ncbi:MAG TPA: MBL fold metallo-hydrolase [Blastocatellia bacterium]|nr:MBL fold metallo-hydrolase [Blastocatellia bacterium]
MLHTMELIQPVLKNEALLADIAAARELADELHLWWLGQSGFLVQWCGRHLLLDPYLSESLTKKYATTDKPHIRMTECPVDPARLDFIDVVTSSHNHTDHLDHETLWPLRKANPNLTMIIPEANRAFVADRLHGDPAWPLGVNDGTSVSAQGFTFTGLAAAHEQLEQDEHGNFRCLGYLVSFDDWTIFHPGDAVPYEGMVENLLRYANGRTIDVALMPINGRLPERRVTGNFWGREAAAFAKAIGARIVIPMHYEMFTFNTETPEEFVISCEQLEQPYQVLRCGERWSVRK